MVEVEERFLSALQAEGRGFKSLCAHQSETSIRSRFLHFLDILHQLENPSSAGFGAGCETPQGSLRLLECRFGRVVHSQRLRGPGQLNTLENLSVVLFDGGCLVCGESKLRCKFLL